MMEEGRERLRTKEEELSQGFITAIWWQEGIKKIKEIRWWRMEMEDATTVTGLSCFAGACNV